MERKPERGSSAFLYLLLTVVILESGAFLFLNYRQQWRLDDFRSKIFHRRELLSVLEAGCSHEVAQPIGGHEVHSRDARQANTLFGFMKELLTAQEKALQAVCATRPDLCIYGSIGLSGLQGPPGIQGSSGANGPKGLKGDIGPTGPGGQKGIIGIQGPTGPKGDAGSLGQKGNQGPKGQSGVSGLKGDPGPIGENATAGGVGEKGMAGPKGQLGIKGQKGVPGVHGEMGVEGIPGAKGEPGNNGYKGILLHPECECLNEFQVLGNFSNDVNVPFGAPMFLHCSFNKPDVNVTWSKDGGPISKRGHGVGGDLTFQQVLTKDGGTYRCSGIGRIHEAISKPVTVNVGQVHKYDCDFESPCSWTNISDVNTDNMDWTHAKGPTPTLGTGPNSDHTLENDNGTYIYLETSAGAPGFHAMLVSEPLNANQRFCLTFWYYMSGSQMGSLEVRYKKAGVIERPIWTMSGTQGSRWILAKVELLPQTASYYLVLNAIKGINYYGDIAVDDIILLDGACQ